MATEKQHYATYVGGFGKSPVTVGLPEDVWREGREYRVDHNTAISLGFDPHFKIRHEGCTICEAAHGVKKEN
jgi:hypothetical protein